MKKLICILLSVLVMGTASFAQDKGTTPSKPKTEKKVTAKKGDKPTSEKTPGAAPGKMKKDGTPDMRHKENKEAAKPKGKLKKDGTPDMRYKENKEAAKKK